MQQEKFAELRRMAEQHLVQRGDKQSALPENMDELLHELELQQEELRIQNEELKSAQQELSDLHREYVDLYEFAPAGYITLSPAGIITRVNLTGVRLLGLNRDHLLRRGFSTFLSEKSRQVYVNTLEKVRQSGENESAEVEIRSGNEGGPLWLKLDVQANTAENGEVTQWSLTFSDITPLKEKKKEELLNNVRELEAVYTHTPVLLFLLDEDRKIRKTNAYAAEYTDIPQEGLKGVRSGEALQCVHHLDDPRGCGFGPHCRNCRVRNLLIDTIQTGRSYDREEVEIHENRGDGTRRLTFLLSTSNIEHSRERFVLLALEDITKQKRREEELRKSEEKFHTIFESANDAFFIHDLDLQFLEVNEVACRNLGYSREELLQKNVEDIEAHADSASISKRLEEVEQDESIVFETAHLRKDGTVVPVEVSSRKIEYNHRPCVLSVVRDITERKKAQESLRLFHNQLLTILENQEAGVFVLSLETGKILYSNSYMKKLFDSELVGQECYEVFGYKEEMCPFCPNYLYAESGKSAPEAITFYEYQPPNNAGRFMVHVRPIRWVDDTEATITIFTDITPYKEAEQLREDIDRITRHDLKSPLNGILGSAQLLASEDSIPEEYREFATIIEESGRNMLRMIDESLSLYKMEKGSYEVEPEEIRENFGKKYATAGKKRGTGLGLYSARLMTETQGGTISWSSSDEEGTTITVRLPAAERGHATEAD